MPLKTLQVRVLKALMSDARGRPSLTKPQLARGAGFNRTSGSVNRALYGIPEGSSSGKPFPGLLCLGLVSQISIDGETVYQISSLGEETLVEILAGFPDGKLPKARVKGWSLNKRYQGVNKEEDDEDEDM